ncbi:cell wall-associated NlpC family hydrolase [Terracoccus luteus]|uniref:Cell wall-associated NlpC family hydrolase n=1 Tax=Terracoccus luteus TaxID=53356 RepID=A0A495XZ42_9MICO|nr:C40 family peptidase [Terracoccus luteus]RKT78144.1 cell wall-associated NlpC family hydrolase [Terracoccus luteus]
MSSAASPSSPVAASSSSSSSPASSRRHAVVRVPVTTVWSAPDSPRPVDAPVVRAEPDAAAWLAALDAEPDGRGRLGLHGRAETQLVAGEPVLVVEEREVDGPAVSDTRGSSAEGTDAVAPVSWSRIVAPWQPSPKDPAGYPGWVPTAHLTHVPDWSETASGPPPATDHPATDVDHPALVLAREHLGLPYLWGGLSPLGLDCSGLVHHTWRRFGLVVPRDASAQAEGSEPVEVDAVRPGDLYFFAHPGKGVHHVGIVVEPGRMVHASETGGVLVEEQLGQDRLDTLVSAGRLPRP